MKLQYTNDDLKEGIEDVAQKLIKSKWKPDVVIGILRGGIVPAIYLSHKFNVPLVAVEWSTRDKAVGRVINASLVSHLIVDKKLLLVDDICDSGDTFDQILNSIENAYYQSTRHGSLNIKTMCLHYNIGQQKFEPDYWHKEMDKTKENYWIEYPWEV